MNILDQILAYKKTEVATKRELYPTRLLEQSIYFTTPVVSLKRYLLREDLHGIIAEIKRKSPSKGFINQHINVEELAIGYMQAGASALSVLTDERSFGGSNKDLEIARKFNFCPILRKEFIVDEYQIVEAKAIGADVILLIAGALEPAQIKQYAATAKKLGLEVLLEVHSREQLTRSLCDDIDVVGVNNRNLEDFSISLDRSLELAPEIPERFVKISESGLDSAATIKKLHAVGFRGFLIGETFMKSANPAAACAALIEELSKR